MDRASRRPAGTPGPGDGLRPMLAVPGEMPEDPAGWGFEFKWDGVRALVRSGAAGTGVWSRTGREVSVAYPELGGIAADLGGRDVVLDGEIVALDEEQRPSFGLLQRRMHVASPSKAQGLAEQVPVSFFAFDLLRLDGRLTVGSPYRERRALLAPLEDATSGSGRGGRSWVVPPWFEGAGAATLTTARARGLEGVVAKRLASPYRPGRRSPEWRKVKLLATQEVVIGGWAPGAGRRRGTIGALLLGVPDGPGGTLRYVGKVGTGFADAELQALADRLAAYQPAACPFDPAPPPAEARSATWVVPRLVGEVASNGWSTNRRLRQPSWRGLRPDKLPVQVQVEVPPS